MVRLSQFATDHADNIAEIDLNPVIVHASGQGVTMVDALIVKRSRQSGAPQRRLNTKENEWVPSRISASRKPAM